MQPNLTSQASLRPARRKPEPLPENIHGVQPGGGVCCWIELAWGRWRRWYLRRFRPGYVRRMAELCEGDAGGAPYEVLDPRDLKYCCNLCDARWSPQHDRFRWRARLPFARWGLAELQLMGYSLAAATAALAWLGRPYGWSALAPAVLLVLVVYFFRDPPRRIPQEAGAIVAPADGRVVEVARLDDDEFVGEPAVRIGIFLSIFNVHINRAPERSRVIRLAYKPGEFLNALNPQSAFRNEAMWIGLEQEDAPYRRMIVRQISGLLARRIVCTLRPGQVVERGAQFGMIKLGSRTELTVPAAGLSVCVEVGDKIKAGSTIVARYATGTRAERTS